MQPSSTGRTLLRASGLLVALLALAPAASAHLADVAALEIEVTGPTARLTLDLPTGVVAFADADRDGTVSPAEAAAAKAALDERVGEGVSLIGDEEPGALTLLPTPPGAVAAKGRTTLVADVKWPAAPEHVLLRFDLFPPDAPTARCIATVLMAGKATEVMLDPAHPERALGEGHPLTAYVRMGVEHILTGWDHLLFVVSLLMLGGGLPYLLGVVTAFTVAHSVTLSLAYFDVVTLPSRLVECVIALSIAWVAGETFWRKSLRGRWALTAGFGLVHGLGFAGALKAIAMPPGAVVPSLLAFNVGVELGQLAVVAVAFGLLRLTATRPWDLAFRRAASGLTVAVALYWFAERAGFLPG